MAETLIPISNTVLDTVTKMLRESGYAVVPLAEWQAAQRLAAAVADDDLVRQMALVPSDEWLTEARAAILDAYRAELRKEEGK
jgi:hypothetical protein